VIATARLSDAHTFDESIKWATRGDGMRVNVQKASHSVQEASHKHGNIQVASTAQASKEARRCMMPRRHAATR